MKPRHHKEMRSPATIALAFLLICPGTPHAAFAYTFNYTVADMRQPVTVSGGSACPRRNRLPLATGGVNRRWSTALGTNPVTILTADQTSSGRLNEIENAILDAFAPWTNVSGSALQPATLAPLARTAAQAACDSTDGLNTICFNQNDLAFTPGVLAFTRVMTADGIGQQDFASQPASLFPGQIMDADIFVRPGDPSTTFATPAALSSQPNAYDLESVLTHEAGHFFGFGHSDVWRAAMYPFVPPVGQFFGSRTSSTSPDAPLADDDRTGERALYPDPSDQNYVGTISGRILPANPLSLAGDPANPTGIFGAHVVAVDSTTGSVVAGAISGWSCTDPGPPVFDGTYVVEHLPVGTGRSYIVYAEPLDGTVDPSQIAGTISSICRNQLTDAGWPAAFACVVPQVKTDFSVRIRP